MDATDFIQAFGPKTVYMTREEVARRNMRLGAWVQDGVPFKDKSGEWYVRDKRGTIRRCATPESNSAAVLTA